MSWYIFISLCLSALVTLRNFGHWCSGSEHTVFIFSNTAGGIAVQHDCEVLQVQLEALGDVLHKLSVSWTQTRVEDLMWENAERKRSERGRMDVEWRRKWVDINCHHLGLSRPALPAVDQTYLFSFFWTKKGQRLLHRYFVCLHMKYHEYMLLKYKIYFIDWIYLFVTLDRSWFVVM